MTNKRTLLPGTIVVPPELGISLDEARDYLNGFDSKLLEERVLVMGKKEPKNGGQGRQWEALVKGAEVRVIGGAPVKVRPTSIAASQTPSLLKKAVDEAIARKWPELDPAKRSSLVGMIPNKHKGA